MYLPSLRLLIVTTAALASAPAVTLVVANGNFSAAGSNPASWTTVETTSTANNDGIYVGVAANSASAQGNVLHFKDGTGSDLTQYIEQSITSNNAGVFADTYSEYTVTMDMGWRNDLTDRNDATYRISLLNATDNVELAFQLVTFPVRATGVSNVYLLTLDDFSTVLSYNAADPANAGDTITLRVARTDADTNAANGGNSNSTTWIDDVRITAVPEPSTALLGALGMLGLLRRRR